MNGLRKRLCGRENEFVALWQATAGGLEWKEAEFIDRVIVERGLGVRWVVD